MDGKHDAPAEAGPHLPRADQVLGPDQIVMRHSPASRLVQSAIILALVVLLWSPLFDLVLSPSDGALVGRVIASGAALYMAAGLYLAEVRYDSRMIAARDALFRTRLYSWTGLRGVESDGEGSWTLRFADNRKAMVPGSLAGIRDFLDYSKRRLDENQRG